MSKVLLREYYELCEGGVCQDLLTEEEKRDISENNAMYLSGLMQMAETLNGNRRKYPIDVSQSRSVEAFLRLITESSG